MFTFDADVNLDGRVSEDDYANLVANMGHPGSWFEGDLTRDGWVTEADYDLLTLRLSHPLAGSAQLAGWQDRAAGVPEPTLATLLLPALLLVRRRR